MEGMVTEAERQAGGVRALWGPVAGPAALVVLVGVALLVGAILLLTGGTFSYVLDDAYIHLAVAENLAWHGHYGTSLGVVANPCSSLIWPFLLVSLQWLGLGAWGPLVLNLLAGLALVVALARIAGRVLPACGWRDQAWLTILLLLPTNVFGLMLTGLEHTLQVALVAWTVALLADWGARPAGVAPPRALLVVLVLGPLVRYENLAVSLPLLGLLAVAAPGRRAAWLAVGALALILAGSAAAWTALGLDPLPASIRAKSLPLVEQEIPGWAGRALAKNLNYRQLAIATLALPLALFVVLSPARPRPERLWAVALGAAVCGHLVFGEWGGFFRYEVYVVVFAMLSALIWLRRSVEPAWGSAPWAARAAWAAAAVVVAVPALSGWLRLAPSARSIFEQQHQMHRFAVEHWQERIAVNDLGWVAWRNPQRVLDLWGLGSPDVLKVRQAARRNPDKDQWEDWMGGVMTAHATEVAMIYEKWFPERPRDWILVGELHLSGAKHTPHQPVVAFYAVSPQAADRLRSALPAWVDRLPSGVRWHFNTVPIAPVTPPD